MKSYIVGGDVYVEHKFLKKTIQMEGGKLTLLSPDAAPEAGAEVWNADGKKIAPGFIDIHTHGAAGVDVNAADAEEFEKICRFAAKNGTTSWLCSILTDTEAQTKRCIDGFLEYRKLEHRGANLLGIHLEGPFLSAEYKGAMPENLLRKSDLSLLREYQDRAEGNIRYMTVSPEVEGIVDDIPAMRALGITIAIGHSGADYETSWQAIQNGAESCTHTFNAMRLLHQHEPAIMGAALESDIYCEAICDGRHLHPGTVRLLLKTKGLDRVVAITDSIMAAGLMDGQYRLGANDIVVENGDAKLAGSGVRAGSTLTQDIALKNLLSFTGRPLEELIPLFTENPAKLIKVFDKKGSIDDGKDADLVILDEHNDVADVFVGGRHASYTSADLSKGGSASVHEGSSGGLHG
jgi:N-acetylglucosamine-6-phosphate deacetylase